jgi:hypothetical protein
MKEILKTILKYIFKTTQLDEKIQQTVEDIKSPEKPTKVKKLN